jgi:hypothetical protein
MTTISEKLKNDLIDVRNKVKETRTNLTGNVVENKAKKAGKSVMEFSSELYNGMETSLLDLTDKLSAGTYEISGEMKPHLMDINTEVKRIHLEVRNYRREITGGYIEDQTIKVLDSAEKRLGKLINKLKK